MAAQLSPELPQCLRSLYLADGPELIAQILLFGTLVGFAPAAPQKSAFCDSPGLGYPVVGDGMSVVVVGSDLLISGRNDILRARYAFSVYRRDCIMMPICQRRF